MTTVIGGILQTHGDDSRTTRRPGVSKIPLLGWLFKRDATTQSESQELLIFITPRIIPEDSHELLARVWHRTFGRSAAWWDGGAALVARRTPAARGGLHEGRSSKGPGRRRT